MSRIKTLNGPRVRGISPVGKEKVYGGNDLPKSQVIKFIPMMIDDDDDGGSDDDDDGHGVNDSGAIRHFNLSGSVVMTCTFLVLRRTVATF